MLLCIYDIFGTQQPGYPVLGYSGDRAHPECLVHHCHKHSVYAAPHAVYRKKGGANLRWHEQSYHHHRSKQSATRAWAYSYLYAGRGHVVK